MGEASRVGMKELLGFGGDRDDGRGRFVGAYIERSFNRVSLRLWKHEFAPM